MGVLCRPACSIGDRWKDPKHRESMMANAKRSDRGAGRKPGTPNGMTHKKMAALWPVLAVEAEEELKKMEKEGLIAPVVVVEDQLIDNDAMVAREAMKQTIMLMRAPGNAKLKLAAASKLLEFTKAKPASTVNSNISAAESFLEALAGKD